MNFDQLFTFQLGTVVHHGFCSISKVGPEAKRLKAGKILIVTDKAVRGAGLLDAVIESVKAVGIPFVVFDDVEVDPGTVTVNQGSRCSRRTNATWSWFWEGVAPSVRPRV